MSREQGLSPCATWTAPTSTVKAKPLKDRGVEVAVYRDIRKLLDDKNIDAVVVATPNHWHALATVWACQAGKDVYVEKPLAYNIWEGRQMVAAARKYGRMVQVGTQSRSSPALQPGIPVPPQRPARRDPLGPRHRLPPPRRHRQSQLRRRRVPATVDYDLWCGPAPKAPLMRKQLHYDWHWFWSTGNGEIGNNGIHVIDVCRWALGQGKPAPRAIAIGGRLGLRRRRRDPQHAGCGPGLPARPPDLRSPQRPHHEGPELDGHVPRQGPAAS